MIFVANVLGENLIVGEIEVGEKPRVVGDDGVVVQYGDPDGVCVVMVADDENDAERRVIATFGEESVIDDLQEGNLQGAPREREIARLIEGLAAAVATPRGPYAGEPDVCEDCGKPLSDDDRDSTAPTLCDSCETQRSYDKVST